MMYKIEFSKAATKTAAKYKKLVTLLDEIMEHPRTGTGHPEPLKAGNSISYSRRITAHDRLIYDIYDETVTVLIIEIEGHYKDK